MACLNTVHLSSCTLTAYMLLMGLSYISCSRVHTSIQTQITVQEFLPKVVGTVVHAIMNPASNSSEAAFLQFVDYFEQNKNLVVTFLISKYRSKPDDKKQAYVVDTGSLSDDLDTSKYTHIYFITNEDDLQKAIQVSFSYFGLRNVFPQFIVFWSVAFQNSINWRKQFSAREFYRGFTDYRILIARNADTGRYLVSLICVMCFLHKDSKLQDSYLLPIYKADSQSLKHLWAAAHKNHHGLTITFEEGELLQVSLYHEERGFIPALKEALNVSVNLDFMVYRMDLPYIQFTSTQISIPSKRFKRFPPSVMFSACMKMDEIVLLSVTRKTEYIDKSWTRVFYPFLVDTWCTLLIFTVSMGIFLGKTEIKKNLRKSEIIMKIIAPLLDKSYGSSVSPTLTTMLNCWALFCVSLTVLHGGELFSSLTVLTPPTTPEKLMDLCNGTQEIRSQSSGRIYNYYLPAIDFKADRLAVDIDFKWRKKNVNEQNRKCLSSIAKKARTHFCDQPDRILVPSNLDKPQLCRVASANPSYRRPVTFIETSDDARRLEKIYSMSPNMFWIKRRSLEFRRIWRPFQISVNYFKRVFEPILTGWGNGGLRDHIETMRIYLQDAPYRAVNGTEFHDSDQFTPMELDVLVSVKNIFLVLFTIAFVAFALEAQEIIKRMWRFLLLKCKSQFRQWRQRLSIHLMDYVNCMRLRCRR